eukprot:9182218-Alexandrium_andersonii.AAC.1
MAEFRDAASTRRAQEGGAWRRLCCYAGWGQGDPAAPITQATGEERAVLSAQREVQRLAGVARDIRAAAGAR